jgi:hypothetical protein
MDETIEEDVIEEVKEEIIQQPIKEVSENVSQMNTQNLNNRLSFNDIDYVKNYDGNVSNVNAPKNISRLEEISEMRSQQRKIEEGDDEENVKLNISDQVYNLDSMDIHNIEEPRMELIPDLLIDEIEVLE